ncbi:MAG TPA: Rieske 2Fe-2S domain-containing protein [Chloroflexia bacterium]|nr:Rieske 2Fe-2S domain-containing protein [Chloroflexia bacterium]
MSQNQTGQAWLEKVADILQQGLGSAFKAGGEPGKQLKNFLNGVWFGHPLHPAMTDIPVGCWMLGTTLDLIYLADEKSALASGADTALGLGILGAVGAAATGLTDWSDTYGKERRTGLIHALLNTGALTANCASWILRRRGQRKLAVLLSTSAFGVASFSAYLGGELVFELGTMVNHNAWTHGPEDWVPLMAVTDLPENALCKAEANGTNLVLVRQAGKVYALNETCSHAGGPLSEGQLEGETVICPWHGSRFCLRDGKVLDGPATFKAPVYEVRERDGQIEVRLASNPN